MASRTRNLATIQRFYYDTAQAFTPYTLDGFTKLVPNSHIFLRSDYLGTPEARQVEKASKLHRLHAAQLRAIYRDNGSHCFPD